MSLLVAKVDGTDLQPDQVAWTDAGWLQATWLDEGDGTRRRQFYPPDKVDFVSKVEEADG